MWQRGTIALAAGLSLAALSNPTAVFADSDDIFLRRYAAKTKEVLEELAIPKEDVSSVKIVLLRQRTDKRGQEIRGGESWIRLNSCDSGHLVIVMNRASFVLDTYTRDGCSAPGVRSKC